MKIIIIVALLVIAAVLFMILRPAQKSTARAATAARRVNAARATGSAPANDNPYRAVSVKCGPGACEAAVALGNRRFLLGEISKLPLPDCTVASCQCKFEHHADRRSAEGDKRAPTALRSELYAASGKPERRTRRGRRKSDFN